MPIEPNSIFMSTKPIGEVVWWSKNAFENGQKRHFSAKMATLESHIWDCTQDWDKRMPNFLNRVTIIRHAKFELRGCSQSLKKTHENGHFSLFSTPLWVAKWKFLKNRGTIGSFTSTTTLWERKCQILDCENYPLRSCWFKVWALIEQKLTCDLAGSGIISWVPILDLVLH